MHERDPAGAPASIRLRLDDQLCFALYSATNAVTRAYRPMLGALGLTYPQYLVMLGLWQDGTSTVAEVADRLMLDAPTVAPLIDQLDRSGWITRAHDRGGRSDMLELTKAGMLLEASAAAAQRSVVCRTGMSPEGLEALRLELNALVERMSALETGKPK